MTQKGYLGCCVARELFYSDAATETDPLHTGLLEHRLLGGVDTHTRNAISKVVPCPRGMDITMPRGAKPPLG